MADRYWVGGTANWDGTAGTKWATTSGGTGGASVPTSADDVFFDNLSTGTCTIATGNTGAKSINCTGFAGTIAGTSAIAVSGSITLSAGMTYSHTGLMTLTGTGTLTTAGKSFSAVTVDGSGITVTLGDALNIAGKNLTVIQGTFDTANYNVTCSAIFSNNSNIRTITLGSSVITISGNNAFNFTNSTNLSFNAGTSEITMTSNLPTLNGGSGLTLYNFFFTGTGIGTRFINGANTFNNLTLNASATGLSQLSIGANQTINGTFTCAGSQATSRGFVRSDTIGTTRTITAATLSANDCDFRDITIAGGATGTAPTRAGDCGGNSGITFPAAKTVYRVGNGTQWSSNSSWSAMSGGTGDNSTNFPLAQDTVIINNSTTLSGTLNVSPGYNIGTLDCSARTNAITLNHNGLCNYYGNYTLGSGVTISGTTAQTFSGRGTMTFTSAGKTITFPITVDTPNGTFQLDDAFSSNNIINHTRGTFNANNYNLTCTRFISGSGLTRVITMGSGLWTLSGTGVVWEYIGNNKTLNKDTANILFSDTSTTAREFRGGSLSYNKFTIGGATGTSTTTIAFDNNSFTEIASTKTVAHTIRFSASQGTIGTWSVTGTAGNVVTVDSSSAGTRRNFTLTNITNAIDYLSVKDIGVTDPNRFYVGANSTDGGNNLNVIFTASPGGGISVSILELLTLTDAQSALYTFADTQTETVTITETQNSTGLFGQFVNESETLTDTQTGGFIFALATTESETLTDSNTGNITFTRTVNESETLTDTENATGSFGHAVNETETITETQNSTGLFGQFVNESETLTDTQTGGFIFALATTESETLTDSNTGNITFTRTVTESELLTDTENATGSFGHAVNETETITETQNGTGVFGRAVNESETISDTENATTTIPKTVTETETLSDSQNTTGSFGHTVTETETLTDTENAVGVFGRTVNESETVTETQTNTGVFGRTVDETETLTDASVGQRAFTYDVAESETLTETTSATYIFVGTTIEPIVLTDTVTSLAIFNSTQLESFILTEEIIGRGWFAVQDGQIPNWTIINDAQSDPWQVINDAQTPQWIDITT